MEDSSDFSSDEEVFKPVNGGAGVPKLPKAPDLKLLQPGITGIIPKIPEESKEEKEDKTTEEEKEITENLNLGEPFCKICSTTNSENFTKRFKDICTSCRRVIKNKTHLCKECGDKNSDNFETGRYSICKKCKSKRSNETKIKVRDSKIDPKLKSIETPKDISLDIEKYLKFNRSIFQVKTLIEIINELKDKVSKLEKQNEILVNRNSMINKSLDEIKANFNEFVSMNKTIISMDLPHYNEFIEEVAEKLEIDIKKSSRFHP
jgi:hypothetical protein